MAKRFPKVEKSTAAETQHKVQTKEIHSDRHDRHLVEQYSTESGDKSDSVKVEAQQPTPAASEEQPKNRNELPDPHSIDQISLSEAKDGAMMRLLRSHRFRQMQIQFDEKPLKDVTLQLKDAGWTWNHHDKTWFLPLGRGTEISKTIDAERLFKQLADQIRESKGLEPVGGLDR